jgi:uncharacterized protein (TIGR03118 family)
MLIFVSPPCTAYRRATSHKSLRRDLHVSQVFEAPRGTGRVCFTVVLLTASNAMAQHFTRADLTADNPNVANVPNIDPNLANAWGVARASGSPWWVADNDTGLSTLYDGAGVTQSLVVTIPPPMGQSKSAPTGIVFNAFNGAFEVAPGQRGIFLFATDEGTISGWNPNVNATVAVIKVNNSASGADYKGLAIGMAPSGPRIYAANFASRQVEVYDAKFHRVNRNAAFTDSRLPANYTPFGIQNVGGNIVVTFVKVPAGGGREIFGPGLGFVDIFDLNGNLLLRLQHNQTLNAPWAIAQAPGDFGVFSHRLLIGNLGDGTIHAYNAVSGKFEGTLEDANGAAISIPLLWAISFGGGTTNSGAATDLYYTAGPNFYVDGLFGKLTPVGSDQRGNSE